MKKNSWSLVSGIILFFVSLLFFGLLFSGTMGEGFSSRDIVIVSFLTWAGQITGAVMFGYNLKKPKSFHSSDDITDKNFFEVLSCGEDFENPGTQNNLGNMIVKIKGFGITLMKFPTSPSYWGNKKPEVGQKFLKDGDYFRQIL